MEDGSRTSTKLRSPRLWTLAVFVSLFAVYHLNWSVIEEGDAVPNAMLPAAILGYGRLSFDPAEFPMMFKWRGHPPFVEKDDIAVDSWEERFGEKTAREWRESGRLEFNGPRYFLVASPLRNTYVSTFGPIPGLFLLPVAAPFLLEDPAAYVEPGLRTSIAKLGSSLLVAACAALVFQIAARRTTPWRALLLAGVYGLGTCAWAVSSQSLWQQTVNQVLLTAGAFFLLGEIHRPSVAALAGFFLGAASACRPTGVLVLGAAALHLLITHRGSVAPLLLGSLVPLVAIGAYNAYYFGNPLLFAQQLAGHGVAFEKTGSAALWQTPLYEGALGLLASPSRGLFVFSPVLAPAFWGIARAFRGPTHSALRPLAASALLTMALQCKWFDWWGGHAYGYRPWLDVVPYLVLLLLPVLDDLLRSTARRVVGAALFAWSIFVQGLGALAYDHTWNTRHLHVIQPPEGARPLVYLREGEARRAAEAPGASYVGSFRCDIDLPLCRRRLWSLSDSMLVYHVNHFSATRARRLPESFSPLRAAP